MLLWEVHVHCVQTIVGSILGLNKENFTKNKKNLRKSFPHIKLVIYAKFGYHGYEYANELKFKKMSLFYMSNNCWKFGNDLFNGCRDMGTQHYRPAYLQALIFKFMFLNLPHCDGLKMLNTAEPQYHFYIGG